MTGSERLEDERSNEDTEDAVIRQAISRGGTIFSQADQMKLSGILIQRVRELVKTIRLQEASSAALGRRIEKLNVWLLIVTITIGVMTVVQAAAAALTLLKMWR